MFVISSIPEKYVGEIVIKDGDMRQLKLINETLVNVPINLRHVQSIDRGEVEQKELTRYYIGFMFPNEWERWYYIDKDARDIDYAKLTTLMSIGLFCNLGDID